MAKLGADGVKPEDCIQSIVDAYTSSCPSPAPVLLQSYHPSPPSVLLQWYRPMAAPVLLNC
eukprot:1160480-Rhodomonas_salina.1